MSLVECGDVRLNVVSRGSGPAVIFCHGFPGLWFSWHKQLAAIAAAGYQAIAFDQRGYGASDRPRETAAYENTHTVADLLHLLDALGAEQAVFVGQDFGAAQVYNLAVRYPERVRGVVGMACPYDFDFAGRGGAGSEPGPGQQYSRAFSRPDLSPNACFAAIAEHQFFHAHYFQQIGPAEAELSARPREFLTRLFWALSADGGLDNWGEYPSRDTGYLDVLREPDTPLPWPWMSLEDMDYFVAAFDNGDPGTMFVGGLSAYRASERNWEINRPWADACITPPSLFIAGATDPVIAMVGPRALEVLQARSQDLRGIHLIEGAGHFVQLEQAEATNRALLAFLDALA